MISTTPFASYPVVCLGGASVTFDAFFELLKNIPPDLETSVVGIHQVADVSAEKLRFENLSSGTKMPVPVITDGMLLQPDPDFVFEGFGDLLLAHRACCLAPASKPAGWSPVITLFLGSLARNRRAKLWRSSSAASMAMGRRAYPK